MLRIYASPDPNSLTLAEYTVGDLFTVIEPPGDVSAYPVELNGVRWYRVRWPRSGRLGDCRTGSSRSLSLLPSNHRYD